MPEIVDDDAKPPTRSQDPSQRAEEPLRDTEDDNVPWEYPDHLLGDTSVVSRLTKSSSDCAAYSAMLDGRRLAISYQTAAELLGAGFGEKRRAQLNALLAATVELPLSSATKTHYARVADCRRKLRKERKRGGQADDGDLWVISTALEFEIPLVSHDKEQVSLARAMGHPTLTNELSLRGDNPPLPIVRPA